MSSNHDCEEEILLSKIQSSLFLSSSEELHKQFLQQLAQFLEALNSDPSNIEALAQSETVWNRIENILSDIHIPDISPLQCRVLRGVVIIARNLITAKGALIHTVKELKIREAMFKSMHQLKNTTEPSLLANFRISCLQFLYNFAAVDESQKQFEPEVLSAVVQLIEDINGDWNDELNIVLGKFLELLFRVSDFLYHALSLGQGTAIFAHLLVLFESIDLKSHALSSLELTVINLFNILVIHESFLRFIAVHNSETDMIRYYTVSEAIITSKTNWEVFELTVILSWNFELFVGTVAEVQQYFKVHEDGEEPIFIYEKLSRVLDIFTALVHFEHARKFLQSYNGVDKLVELLGVLHQNIKAKRLKDSEKVEKEEGIVEYKSFPHTKSMIIEILNALIYENFEMQEKMREIHGLELVLSNCIIDDNEPFIKERSIVCLRFLLLGNEKNQEFVSKMEARQAIQDDTLDEAGFEVEITDGKVKLKDKRLQNA